MTFSELVDKMDKLGMNCACVAVARMMDIIEEEEGEFPDWLAIAPQWVVDNCLGKGVKS